MKKSMILFLCVITIFLVSPGVLHADIIDFDDLTASDLFIPQGYQGLSWLGGAGESSWVNNASFPIDYAGAHSGSNFAWSNGGTSLELTDGLFDISSLWVRNRSDIPVWSYTIEGWLGAANLFTTTITSTNTWSLVSLGYSSIDKLTISSGHNLLIDDIDLTLNPVPEPTTMLLLGSGLAGLVGFRRRFRAK